MIYRNRPLPFLSPCYSSTFFSSAYLHLSHAPDPLISFVTLLVQRWEIQLYGRPFADHFVFCHRLSLYVSHRVPSSPQADESVTALVWVS